MNPSDVVILAVRSGTDFLIDAGRGNALGLTDTRLARIFSFETGELDPVMWPVDALTGRGYWNDPETATAAALDEVRARVAALTS